MEHTQDIKQDRLAHAWAELQAHSNTTAPLRPDSNRLAFADPEFLLRRETRAVRIQLEMLKPELDQQEQGVEHTVVVFGSARFPAPEQASAALQLAEESGDAAALALAKRHMHNAHYYDQARLFARLVAEYSEQLPASEKLFICTGGGPGIMEAANRGAHEMKAPTIGLNIVLPHEQTSNPYISPSLNFKFHYFALRKMHFMMRAKALVAFPGGFGTFDELFEALTLVQTRKVKPIPVVLVGESYWRRAVDTKFLVEEGVVAPEDLELFWYAETAREIWDGILHWYDKSGTPLGAV